MVARQNRPRTYKAATTPSGIKIFVDNYGNQYFDNGRMLTADKKMQSYDISMIPEEMRKDYWETPEQVEEQQVTLPSKEVIAARYYTPYNGLFSSANLKQYQSFGARKKYIQDNAAWLKQQGFDTANYRGSEAQNLQLLKLIQKKQEFDARKLAKSEPVIGGIQVSTVDPAQKLSQLQA